MTQKEVRAYFYKISGRKDIPVIFSDSEEMGAKHPAMVTVKPCAIYLNKDWLIINSDNETKSCILHEIGHIIIGNLPVYDTDEFFAQLWALWKSETIEQLGVAIEVGNTFLDWGDPRNSHKECYVFAYRKAV